MISLSDNVTIGSDCENVFVGLNCTGIVVEPHSRNVRIENSKNVIVYEGSNDIYIRESEDIKIGAINGIVFSSTNVEVRAGEIIFIKNCKGTIDIDKSCKNINLSECSGIIAIGNHTENMVFYRSFNVFVAEKCGSRAFAEIKESSYIVIGDGCACNDSHLVICGASDVSIEEECC